MKHIPVLLEEVITALRPRPNGIYIDATVGDGGHTAALLEASEPNGRVIGIDQDENQILIAQERLQRYGERVSLFCIPFSHVSEVARNCSIREVDGILFDLGVSSRQIASTEYGLTLMDDDAALDMRLSREREYTAADLLNRTSEQEIADILFQFGDRYNSRTLAKKIVAYRKKRPFQVAYDLKKALAIWRPNTLAPIFQALRIAVNDEVGELESALPQAVALLKPGGTIAVISFHSGEDRIVKRFFQHHRELLEVPKRIIRPSFEEIKRNPRARSAKLRTATKVRD